MPLKTDCYCVFMHVFCCMHIVIKHCGVCFVDLSLGSASGKVWRSLPELCNFMANCIVSMQRCLFTWILPHKSPRAPIHMSETCERSQWRLLNSYFVEEKFQSCLCWKTPWNGLTSAVWKLLGCLILKWLTAFSLPQLCKTHLATFITNDVMKTLSKWMTTCRFFCNQLMVVKGTEVRASMQIDALFLAIAI